MPLGLFFVILGFLVSKKKETNEKTPLF